MGGKKVNRESYQIALEYHKERILSLVFKPDCSECHLWLGTEDPTGYGRYFFDFGPDQRSVLAHRIIYVIKHGMVPDELDIDHLCRNPGCVNVEHLEAVTPKENFLRGVGCVAINARKTHCNNGHALVGYNLMRVKGGRMCRTCNRNNARRYRAERKAGLR